MADSSAAPLKGARIWLSGSIPDGADPDGIRSFVAQLSAGIFRNGGSIIHGSHPTIWPTLQQQAAEFQQAGGARDCLTMAISRHFSSEPDKHGIDMKAWRSCSLVYEVPAESGDDKKAQNLERLRNWIAERCDAVVVVGGKGWDKNPGGAGIPAEFELARERGLPCFLAASMGGAAGGYLRERPEILRNLRNGLDSDENLALATALKADALADRIVEQLRRLPLVRGEPRSGSTFRILSLDGGGIKGTFTAAVLAEWERITKCKLTDHFDLIAGTSTGGILALGLGMGLSAQTMLEFYEQRGPTVFPMTSFWAEIPGDPAFAHQTKICPGDTAIRVGDGFRQRPQQNSSRRAMPARHSLLSCQNRRRSYFPDQSPSGLDGSRRLFGNRHCFGNRRRADLFPCSGSR